MRAGGDRGRVKGRFYVTKGYRQNYMNLHPESAYIHINDLPKVEVLRNQYRAL